MHKLANSRSGISVNLLNYMDTRTIRDVLTSDLLDKVGRPEVAFPRCPVRFDPVPSRPVHPWEVALSSYPALYRPVQSCCKTQ